VKKKKKYITLQSRCVALRYAILVDLALKGFFGKYFERRPLKISFPLLKTLEMPDQ
jgi:hypothetical protein